MRKITFLSFLFALRCGGETSGAGSATGSGGAGSGASASCTFTETLTFQNMSTPITFCSDTSGLTADQVNALKSTCVPRTPVADASVTLSGVYSDGPCPSANRLGGCSITSGGYTQTAWYYTDINLTMAQLQMICAQTGGTFVPP